MSPTATQHPGPRPGVPWSLVAWLLAACALFLLAPEPPPTAVRGPEDDAIADRWATVRRRQAERWDRERGDLRIPWNDAQGHLAILIDDVGRELHILDQLQSLRFRLTFAILPGAVYAPGAQLRLRDDPRRYREIFVHLPMEPWDAHAMSRGDETRETFLLADDDRAVLRQKTADALRRVPFAVGVNNHMGSRLTTDRDAMDTVMSVLSAHSLAFVDSRTDPGTRAEAAARAAGLRAGSRRVFLDNVVTEAAIEAQLMLAAEQSREAPVIAIGHPSTELHSVLRRGLEDLYRDGIGVYPVSWLVSRADAAM